MITAIVRFTLPAGTTARDAQALFEGSAPNYRATPGLIRKYYLFGEDGTGGGVYLWQDRASAEALYNADWKAMIEGRFGAAPEISYFETAVIVDNQAEEIITEAA